MKLSIFVTLCALFALPACDDKKEEATRPDLQAPESAPKEGAGAPGVTAEGKAIAAKGTAGRVFFVTPLEGAKVPEMVEVEFGVEGKQVRPAGATERDEAFGHHHLFIDGEPLDDMVIVPKDETHLHYGDGATKAVVKLPPGKHQLTMQFADGAHRSYGPDWAATVTVDVQPAGEPGAGEAGAGEAEAGAAAEAEG